MANARLRPALAAAALAVAIGAGAAPAADRAAGDQKRPPKVGELHYFKQSGEPGPATRLEVFARRADAVRMKASYGGETAKAAGVPYKPVESNRYGHPWIPDPKRGRRELINTIKHSIEATGAATVIVTARNDAGRSKAPVRIAFSECSKNPPLYPFTCTIEL